MNATSVSQASLARAANPRAFAQYMLCISLFLVPMMADVLAQLPYYGLEPRLYPWTIAGAAVVSLFLILLLAVNVTPDVLERLGSGNARRVLMLVCLLPALVTFPFMGGTPSIPFRLLFAALGVIWLALLVRNPGSLVWFLLLAVAYSFIQRYRFLAVVHIQVEFSDILPLIQLAAHNFLAGTSPYVIYDLPPVLPLVYLPVTWLSYVPSIAAGLDMRYTNLVAELGIVLVFLSLVFPKRHVPAVNFALGYAAFLFVLPTAMFWDSFTAHPIWWFWLLLSMRFLIAQKFFLAALALGVTLATAQLAIVILPVIALYILRKAGVLRALLYFVVIAGTALLIVGPFAYRDPFKFINDTFLYYGDLKNYGRVLWKDDQRWQYILGFGGEAWRRGFPDALRYVQGSLTVIIAGLYAFLIPNSSANLLRAAAAALGFFLLSSAVVWHYYYQAVFFLVLFYVAALSIQAHTTDQGVVTS